MNDCIHIEIVDTEREGKSTVTVFTDEHDDDENYPVFDLTDELIESICGHVADGMICPRAVSKWREMVATVEAKISEFTISDDIECCNRRK